MRALLFLSVIFSFSSCWIKERPSHPPSVNYYGHVWGNKPVYSRIDDAKQITYIDSAVRGRMPGNIYAKGDRLYQMEIGRGIHVIDNSVPAQARRIGFIVVNGCSQVSIKDNNLYTNSYDDLVVIDITNLNTIQLVKRLEGAFPEAIYSYFLVEPEDPGFYECPRYDSVITGWVQDSIWTSCQK